MKTGHQPLSISTELLKAEITNVPLKTSPTKTTTAMAHEPLFESFMIPNRPWENDFEQSRPETSPVISKRTTPTSRAIDDLEAQVADLLLQRTEDEEFRCDMLRCKDAEIARLCNEISEVREHSREMEIQFSTLQAQKDHLSFELSTLKETLRALATENRKPVETQLERSHIDVSSPHRRRYDQRREQVKYLNEHSFMFGSPSRRTSSSTSSCSSSATSIFDASSPRTRAPDSWNLRMPHRSNREPISSSTSSSSRSHSSSSCESPSHSPRAMHDFESVCGISAAGAWHVRHCSVLVSLYETRAKLNTLWGAEGERDANGVICHDARFEGLFHALQVRAETLAPELLRPCIGLDMPKENATALGKKLLGDKYFCQLRDQYTALSRRKLFLARGWHEARTKAELPRRSSGYGSVSGALAGVGGGVGAGPGPGHTGGIEQIVNRTSMYEMCFVCGRKGHVSSGCPDF